MPSTMRLLRFASVSMLAAAATVTALRVDEQVVLGQPGKVEPLANPEGPSLSDLASTTREVSMFAGYLRACGASSLP